MYNLKLNFKYNYSQSFTALIERIDPYISTGDTIQGVLNKTFHMEHIIFLIYVHNHSQTSFIVNLLLYYYWQFSSHINTFQNLDKYNINFVSLMLRKKLKIQLEDSDGSKYSIMIDGNISKEKIIKMVNILDEKNDNHLEINKNNNETLSNNSIFGNIIEIIDNNFTLGSFTSSDILEAYEYNYNNLLPPSTISTYLSRMTSKGMLSRYKTGSNWTYKKIKNLSRFIQH